MDLRNLLTETRKEKKITLEMLAELSGVSKSTIRYYEQGGQITLEKADAVCKAMGISVTIGKMNIIFKHEEEKKI